MPAEILIWWGIGTVLLTAEILFPAFILVFFAFGAILSGIAAFFIDTLILQVFVFALSSVFSLFALRRTLLRTFSGFKKTENAGVPKEGIMCGQKGTVSREILPGKTGEVAIGGSFWSAVSNELLPVGTEIRVVKHTQFNDLTLEVTHL